VRFDTALSFQDTWRSFAQTVTAALAGRRRQRHGGARCKALACDPCSDDILRALEMIHGDQDRYLGVSPASARVIIRRRFLDGVLRPRSAERGFGHRPERLVARRSVRAAAIDPIDRMLLGQLMEHVAYEGRTPALTDALGRWTVDGDFVNMLVAGLCRRRRIADTRALPPAEELAQRLVRCLAALAISDPELVEALVAAARQSGTSLPLDLTSSLQDEVAEPARPAAVRLPAYGAALSRLADEVGRSLVELLRACPDARHDVLGSLRLVIAQRGVRSPIALLVDEDQESARDVIQLIAERLTESAAASGPPESGNRMIRHEPWRKV
jgi:hypothetical protein